MKKNILLAGFIFLFLAQSPLLLAISCNSVSLESYETCLEILESNIPEEEKNILISNLDYNNKTIPNHEYIFNINSNKEINSVPEGTKTHDKEFIKNAWVDIFSLMPSVLYKNVLYAPEKTTVFTGFNYELKIPDNYYSDGYPETKKEDCKTKYYLNENEAENKIYVNGKYVGKGKFVDISLEKDSEIKSEYTINVKIKIMHYEWDKSCSSRREDGSCRKYSYDCEHDYDEYKDEQIKISNTIQVKLYKNNLFAKVEPLNIYDGSISLEINYSDSVWIYFTNSKYHFNKFIYSIEYSKPNYYINTLKAEDYNQEEISNLYSGENILTIKGISNCRLKYFDFFKILESDCNTSSNSFDFFIKTDKLKYNRGEEINVNIFPKNISVKISYGDQSKIAKESTKFTAQSYENRIVAEYNGVTSEKIIYIKNKERLMIIWNIIIFIFLNYFLYILLGRYYKKIR